MTDRQGLRAMTTLARLSARGLGRALRPRSTGSAAGPAFGSAMRRHLADPAVARQCREVRLVKLGPDGGWQSLGFDVQPGDEVTVLAAGGFWASKLLDLRFGARMGIWLRPGAGAIVKTPADAASLRMEAGGPLHIVAKPPGEWADESGTFDPAFPRSGVSGEIDACVIVWKEGALSGLGAMARAGDHGGLVAAALERARHPVPPPRGWRYLWRLGAGEIYSETSHGGERRICCHTRQDVGILQFPADFPLTESTRLRWRWKVDKLPCDLPEDIQPTHDYLSIAVEFEDGQDLTYMWSSSLPEGTIFRCPLPFWDKVETHWVLRADAGELGRWLAEERPLRADYAKAIGTPPARIVKVWLIAVSVFQRGEGICEYADIELVDGERVLKIL